MDEDQLETIEKILYKESKLNDFLEKNHNICDLLKAYDSIKLDFFEFYSIMPKILVNVFFY
jgi:sulfite reductase alpha subunit-like flavoprotein